MGLWLNNFSEFERKRNRENRLVLHFYEMPEDGREPRKLKVYLKKRLRIPTDFLFGKRVDEVLAKVPEAMRHEVGKYTVLETIVENSASVTSELPKQFQTESYDKMLRLRGFYPERKVMFSEHLEARVAGFEEIELDSMDGATEMGFLNEAELRGRPWLYFDIEKPLWKEDNQKKWIRGRKKILRLDKKFGDSDGKHEVRMKALKMLQDRLTLKIAGVEEIRLWEEKYDARVTHIGTTWKNCYEHGIRIGEIKELYCVDEEGLLDVSELNGFRVVKYLTEKELIKGFIDAVHRRKPLVASGHNEVYDATQIRFAAESFKMTFDPAVKDVSPRRDFVRYFFQRMREDWIYVDSMWLNAIMSPYLRQRNFSSLRLGDTARHHGVDFEKSMTHEELKLCEFERIGGNDTETRKKATFKLADYATKDILPVVKMIEDSAFLSLITKMKTLLPYCTLTEIAFYPNCVQKYHEKRHFDRARNLRLRGHAQKERENETQIFKKRFPVLKKKMLEWAGIQTRPMEGVHENVYEIYLPFEEWIRKEAFSYAPEFGEVYKKIRGEEKIGFLQYLKALEKDMLIDYYFAKREAKILTPYDCRELREKFELLKNAVPREMLDRYVGGFRYLKNHFRSIFVALDGKGRALIRPTKKNLEGLVIPEVMMAEKDLFLLRTKAEEVSEHLSPAYNYILRTFLSNFKSVESNEEKIASKAKEAGVEIDRGQLYLFNQSEEKARRERTFYARFGFGVERLGVSIASAYCDLSRELDKNNTQVLEQKGDYLFVKADSGIERSALVYVVRNLEEYEVKKSKRTYEEE